MTKTKWYQKPIYLLAALALVLSLGIAAVPMAGTVEAATINVPVDYPTIQQAVDNATAGDTINVAAGTYYESITLKDGVQVLGAGADVTTIDGSTARGGQPAYHVVVGADNATLDGFTVTGGNATGDVLIDECGGGMLNNASSLAVANCIFSGNSAEYGGGMYNYESSPAVTNCIFSGNSATAAGGMYNYKSSPTVANCIFSGNSAPHYGGGMVNESSSPKVTSCIFSGNSATTAGGGGMINIDSSPAVTNCIFSGNSATNWGGGGMLNYLSSSPAVTNCIFHGNSAGSQGGGMYSWNSSSPTVTNCIFANNSAGSSVGGLYADGSSSPTIDYNDVWNNPGGNYGGSCSPGANDIFQDPLFVDPVTGDYHLQPGSPCIDAGTNVGAPTEDIEGSSRPIDGDVDGTATTDMGAYEYVPPTPPSHFRYLHAEGGLFNLTTPIGTQWHELWPFFCKEYYLSSWNDTSGDGVLSYCDRIDMYEKPDGAVKWYHVEDVTITLNVTHNETGERMYIELEGGYNASVLTAPNSTQWHEIYPNFCRQYELIGWNDTSNITGELDFCDTIDLTDKATGEETYWHVEEVAIDIIVTIEPSPVGGEAYPVNKFAVLAPWIGLALLLAGGMSWLTLRRRRAQS